VPTCSISLFGLGRLHVSPAQHFRSQPSSRLLSSDMNSTDALCAMQTFCSYLKGLQKEDSECVVCCIPSSRRRVIAVRSTGL
jgi:hypothetical protein